MTVNMRTKAASSINATTTATVTKQPTKPVMGTKKIDMGAAANFGKTSAAAAGIHSPTHRDSPVNKEPTLAALNNNIGISNSKQQQSNNINNNNLLDDLFKTCPVPKSSEGTISGDDLDDFNPRAEDPQDFGDFASAFGNVPPVTAPIAPIDEFEDFAAFQESTASSSTTQSIKGGIEGNLLTTATPANAAFNLFDSRETDAEPHTAMTATDLLAGLGDLSIHQSMPMGKLIQMKYQIKIKLRFIFNYIE